MATSMDVDPQEGLSVPTTVVDKNDRILVHPLAIVTMSDQYTRIRSGGSPMDSDAPVTGLLFGTVCRDHPKSGGGASSGSKTPSNKSSSTTSSSSDVVVEVRDAEDIPLDVSESALLQEELHRAVFPTHAVVGWYRVSETDDVLESDVILTHRLAGHYNSAKNNPQHPFLFALLAMNDSKSGRGGHDTDDDPDEDDEPLPLTVYRPSVEDKDGVLLHNVPDWTLETLDSERIAVERVIRDKPHVPSSSSSSSDARSSSDTANALTSLSLDGPRFVQHANTMEHSLTSMDRRLDVLRIYLQDTMEGKIPWNPSLMRHVNEVVLQAEAIHRPTSGGSDESNDEDALMVPIAYLLKTVDAVRSYSDKFRAVQESNHSSSSTTSTSTAASALSSKLRDRDFKRL